MLSLDQLLYNVHEWYIVFLHVICPGACFLAHCFLTSYVCLLARCFLSRCCLAGCFHPLSLRIVCLASISPLPPHLQFNEEDFCHYFHVATVTLNVG